MLITEKTNEQLTPMKSPHNQNIAENKPIKKTIRVQLDADILEWLKSTGRCWQVRMNAILREAMLQSV
ncbi:MAG: BrnA antitoxin family protein [Treponema sp.]|nr:BrnA antitoxin family protein [Treponema sp.]